ncbi:hypothetical protein FKW77_001202 [Venturia effusa]|uniref:Uncharacterized protein n=1 Tax=Venturia effusa TaxID=50376 RepID=A0A517LGP4_9PEZI|nr:hypothetical protein FKW77_001202 [Venturia effusa]
MTPEPNEKRSAARSTHPSRCTSGMQKSSNPWLTASWRLSFADHASAVELMSYGCAVICKHNRVLPWGKGNIVAQVAPRIDKFSTTDSLDVGRRPSALALGSADAFLDRLDFDDGRAR